MGRLKPGASYVYERVGNSVYAREAGADPSTRIEIGYTYDPVNGHEIDYDRRTPDGRPLFEHLREDQLWHDIRRMARTDPGLQDLLERAIVYYNLKREHDSNTTWHPV